VRFEYSKNATVYYDSDDSLNGNGRKSGLVYNVTSSGLNHYRITVLGTRIYGIISYTHKIL
jgi:hypothetical protein